MTAGPAPAPLATGAAPLAHAEADAAIDMQPQPTFRSLLSFDLGALSLDGHSSTTSPGAAAPAAPPPAPSPHGYDLLVRIVRATQLPAADWWNGLADPYVVARVVAPDGAPVVQYRCGSCAEGVLWV